MTLLHDERARRLHRNLAAAKMGEAEKFRARGWLWLTRTAGSIAGCSIHREWVILAVLVRPEAACGQPEAAAARHELLRDPVDSVDLRQRKAAVVSWKEVEVLRGGKLLRWKLGLECGHEVERTGPGREVTGEPHGPHAYPPALPDGRRFTWRPTKVSCDTCTGKVAWNPYSSAS